MGGGGEKVIQKGTGRKKNIYTIIVKSLVTTEVRFLLSLFQENTQKHHCTEIKIRKLWLDLHFLIVSGFLVQLFLCHTLAKICDVSSNFTRRESDMARL